AGENAAPQPGGCPSAVRRRRRWQCGVPAGAGADARPAGK
ncbi:RHS repeat protein, partial [Shigella sonnei]|nr:RHS repeat protein [Shigella sonnei]EFX0717339.1 RHS repeat protein [Shigella sonnei]EFX0730718.1 RHS repeat protein [Shigella sonnei]EGD8262584.1 RHS repeat protein [Shigella sonnei]EGE0932281.1 RHS Repeat family protein [Shigella sonnei]